MSHTPERVCVVGAGPVGLTIAYLLLRRGVPVDIYESEATTSTEWRASTFHPPTLELFDTVGLANEMVADGLVARHYQIRDLELPERVVFDLDVLGDDTKFPFRLQYEQYKLAELLTRVIEPMDHATMTFSTPVVDVRDGPTGATVAVRCGEHVTEHDYRLVVGADGARSRVRESLGIAFAGMTYPSTYILLSVASPLQEHIRDLHHVNYIGGSEEHIMLLRIPDLWRVLLSTNKDSDRLEAAAIDEAYVAGRLHSLIDGPVPKLTIAQRQIYRIHQKIADTFRNGHVVLAGDAAHVNSPFGGLGLNSGVHDAFDLVRSVGGPLLHDDSDTVTEALRGYESRRRKVATDYVQRVSDETTRLLSDPDSRERLQQLEKLDRIAHDTVSARGYLRRATMIQAVEQQPIGP